MHPLVVAARPPAQEAVRCDIRADVLLPDAKYFFSPDYGWFDATHFGAGDPAGLIESVRRTAETSGNIVTVEQGLHNGIMGYKAHYWVAGNGDPTRTINVALGIYLDWSKRFESWQGKPPRVFIAPLTSYAVEDLPSHYIGFIAAAWGLSPAQVLYCYLGGVEDEEGGPPDFVMASENDIASFQRLENRSFTPVVETNKGWRHVLWPKELRLTAAAPGPRTWRFIDDHTWYLQADE